MGHPVIIGKLMEVMNARQGQTLTREQIAGLAGVTPGQVRDGMRSLVERSSGSVQVVVRARAWRMVPDHKASEKAPVASPAVSKPAPAPRAPEPAQKEPETVQKAASMPELLEVLGITRLGGLMARSEDGRLWEAKEL
jgi:hypothetical protein